MLGFKSGFRGTVFLTTVDHFLPTSLFTLGIIGTDRTLHSLPHSPCIIHVLQVRQIRAREMVGEKGRESETEKPSKV